MPASDPSKKNQPTHLHLPGKGKIALRDYQALSMGERLTLVRRARGRQKYELLLNAPDSKRLVPRLHPQELYLTVNELGAESSLELIQLASPEQITTLLDLDCWNEDSLSSVLSLHWLAMLLETGPEKLCSLVEQLEPELLALFLKKHLHITRGLEAYDDDDAENSRRLESIYDVEFASEDAGKIITPLLRILAEQAQESYLLLMEMIRSETMTVLEDEVYLARNNRLLDLGFVPYHQARAIYGFLNPETFVPGGKSDFALEAEGIPHPGAILAHSDPKGLLANVLSRQHNFALDVELCLLVNRKLSADRTDVSSSNEVSTTLEEVYDRLNLALEYLAGQDLEQAETLIRSTYLQRLFQLGHSLIQIRRERGQILLKGPIGAHLDYPEQLFLDALTDRPAAFYRQSPEKIQGELLPISGLQELSQVDDRLEQIEALQNLFDKRLPFPLPPPKTETDEAESLSTLFLTAVANHLLGRSFAPALLAVEDLLLLKGQTFVAGELNRGFQNELRSLVGNVSDRCDFFVDFCLDCWREDLGALDFEQLSSERPICLLIGR